MPLPLPTLLALAANVDRAALADELQAAPPEATLADLPTSAMCYEPMPVEPEVVFVCPVCGARTEWDGADADRALALVEAVRAAQAALPPPSPDLAVQIDATGLCRRCHPDGGPRVALVVRRADRPAVRSEGVTAADLGLVTAFLADPRTPAVKLAALPQEQAARITALLSLAGARP